MKNIFLYGLSLGLLLSAQAQNWTWAETAGGILPDEAGGCTMDSSGNMYMSGFFFSSSINFNSGNSLSNGGICDGFVVKYNPSGNSVWASKVKGNTEDKATRCAVDNAGNVLVTGYFDSPSIQFGGNNVHSVSNSNAGGGTFDAFIVKYSSAGTPLWFHAIGETDDDGGNSVIADGNGNVYVTGWFRASSIVVGGVTLYNENPAGGTSDMFLIKYDPVGNVLWAKSAGSLDDDKGNGCIVDRSGNVIVTGYFKGDSINFEGSYYPNHGSKDAFVAKYSATGLLIETRVFGGSGSEEPFACSTDNSDNVFVCGNFSSSTVVFDAETITNTGSGSGAFLAKLNSALNTLWAFGASSNANDEARGCSTDKYGNTVIAGVFNGSSITFDSTVLSNNGGEEIFLVKYSANGNLLWAKKVGKSRSDGANDCYIHDEGKVLVAGYYNSSSLTLGNIDLDNSYIGVATSDVFVASTCNAAMGTDIQTACGSFIWIDGTSYTASNNTATYTLAGSAANTCDSMVTLNLTIDTVDVSVSTAGQSLTANSTGAGYRWLDCNNNFVFMQGEAAQTFTASVTSGNYAVEVTEGGCTDTSLCFSVLAVGVYEINSAASFRLFPNPAVNNVTIHLSQEFESYVVEVLNQFGELLYSGKGNHTFEKLNLETFAPGIYLIQLRTPQFSEMKKLTIIR